MNQKLLSKVVATMLVMTLTLANIILLGVYASNSYATSDNLEKQGTATNNENVEFDAYFKNTDGVTTHSAKQDINQQNIKMYVHIKVKKGYLKDAKIKIFGEEATKLASFKIVSSNESLETIQKFDIENNQIELKQLNQGTETVLQIPITANKDNLFSLSNFNKENGITLTGSYVGSEGKTVAITKNVKVRMQWMGEAKVVLEQSIQRYVPYDINKNKGILLQTMVTSGLENNNLPIQETNLAIVVPTIKGVKPSKVNVTANTTIATNGQNGLKFGTDNWSYHEETGILNIQVKNEAQDDKVAWEKNGKDVYIVTYIFPQEVMTEEGIQGTQQVTAKIKAYNNTTTEVENSISGNIEVKEKIGELVTQEVKNSQEGLSKGYLYSKAEREIAYYVKSITDIGYAELVDKIVIENKVDNFVSEKGETYPTTISNRNDAYYKSTSISKENFEKILGTEGSMAIKDQDGATLATFNKETLADEKGNYVYSYVAETNKVTIETSKPIASGKLEMEHVKSLKGQTDYTKEQIQGFRTLSMQTAVSVFLADAVIGNMESNATINLVDPTTKLETEISTDRLSTIVKNENVEFRVILKTNDITCDLYKNPVVEIVLPNYIQKLEIKDIKLLFDEELQIDNYETYANAEGNAVIRIIIKGEDTKYNTDSITKGANIVINSDITLKNLTPTKEAVMKVYVTNENATAYENTQTMAARSIIQKGYAEAPLKSVAPVGMVTTNEITGYNAKNEVVTSISGQEQTGKLETKAEARTATVTMNIINNYNNVANNISILGRIPFAGNKAITAQRELGSTMTTAIKNKIIASGVDSSKVTIYYSTKGEATKDLTNTANEWTTTPGDFSIIKSYLVVLSDYEMKTGDTLNVKYEIDIPATLDYNKVAYATYVVYFDNVKVDQTIKDTAVATTVGISTGVGPNLEVKIRSNVETGASVQEGQIITYTATVRNMGNEVANKVTLSGNIPEGTIYTKIIGEEGTESGTQQIYDENVKTYSEDFLNMAAGETKRIEYKVKVKALSKTTEDDKEVVEERTLQTSATVKVQGHDGEFVTDTITSKVIEGFLDAIMDVQPIPASVARKEGETITYVTEVTNTNWNERKEVVVTNTLPEGVSFKEASEGGTYDAKTNTVTWKLGTLAGDSVTNIILTVTVDKLPIGQNQKVITNKMKVSNSEKEIQTNEIDISIKNDILNIKQTTSTQEKVSVGGSIKYNIIVKNTGSNQADDVVITDYIAEGLIYQGAKYILNGKTYESNIGTKEAIIMIPSLGAGETLEITITVEADELEENQTQRQVTNIVKLEAQGKEEKGANPITHTIVPIGNGNGGDSSTDETIEGTYRITGTVWLDSNKDGRRDDNESTLGDIQVMLINADNGQIVVDPKTGKNKVQNTNENGQYTFVNLKPGKYLSIFFYDTSNYGLASYQKAGVSQDRNSDVIAMSVRFNGAVQTAGVSNNLQIANSDIMDIDMGLILSPKFDLKLDKVISKITVNDNKGSKVHEYKDTKLAKLDINPKTVDNTNIVIEYKIRVTNEGAIAGYAKKVIDYIPKDMKFSSELNPDWYAADNGNVYNSSLANTILQPGETKEFNLLLTKKMTSNNTGIINNTAEIYEAYNDLGIQDIDSTPANKVQGEDDMSLADALVGLNTGETVIYVAITLLTIVIFGAGIYLINKKVLRKI